MDSNLHIQVFAKTILDVDIPQPENTLHPTLLRLVNVKVIYLQKKTVKKLSLHGYLINKNSQNCCKTCYQK